MLLQVRFKMWDIQLHYIMRNPDCLHLMPIIYMHPRMVTYGLVDMLVSWFMMELHLTD